MFILLFNHFKKFVGVASYERLACKASHDFQKFGIFLKVGLEIPILSIHQSNRG